MAAACASIVVEDLGTVELCAQLIREAAERLADRFLSAGMTGDELDAAIAWVERHQPLTGHLVVECLRLEIEVRNEVCGSAEDKPASSWDPVDLEPLLCAGVLGQWEQPHPMSQGDEVVLPCGRQMMVTHLVENIGGALWRQWVAVVPAR